MKTHKNPALYRELSEPFESDAAANAALDAFFDDVAVAREKHGIADVHILTMMSYLDEGKAELQTLGRLHLGNSMNSEAMCAYGFGVEQRDRNALVASLLKGK